MSKRADRERVRSLVLQHMFPLNPRRRGYKNPQRDRELWFQVIVHKRTRADVAAEFGLSRAYVADIVGDIEFDRSGQRELKSTMAPTPAGSSDPRDLCASTEFSKAVR